MHTKKSQALSMNTIIIAALALLVLAIVSLLFISRMNFSRQGLSSCENNGGLCFNTNEFGGSCNQVIQRAPYTQYSQARRVNHVCYNMQGDPNPDEMCCILS